MDSVGGGTREVLGIADLDGVSKIISITELLGEDVAVGTVDEEVLPAGDDKGGVILRIGFAGRWKESVGVMVDNREGIIEETGVTGVEAGGESNVGVECAEVCGEEGVVGTSGMFKGGRGDILGITSRIKHSSGYWNGNWVVSSISTSDIVFGVSFTLLNRLKVL